MPSPGMQGYAARLTFEDGRVVDVDSWSVEQPRPVPRNRRGRRQEPPAETRGYFNAETILPLGLNCNLQVLFPDGSSIAISSIYIEEAVPRDRRSGSGPFRHRFVSCGPPTFTASPDPQPIPFQAIPPPALTWHAIPIDEICSWYGLPPDMVQPPPALSRGFGPPELPSQEEPAQQEQELSLDSLKEELQSAGSDGGIMFTAEGGFRHFPSEN
jgi:hypothetical protein